MSLLLVWPKPAARGALVADLSHHLIAITTAFTGTDVLLFGALDEPGADVVVVVRGPLREHVVRRKAEVGFIWLNTRDLAFRGVPEYYAVAATRPLEVLAPEDELARHQIGAERLRLQPVGGGSYATGEIDSFRAALIRNKRRAGLYADRLGRVTFLGDKLFRTTLAFPGNVPPGTYQVQVLQLRNGTVIGAQSSALVVSKVGLEADLFQLARQRPALYGLATVAAALLAGWTASLIFQKR